MRVGFDEQIFLLQKRGGVSRYFVELIREFSSNSSYGIEPILGFKTTSNEMLFKLSDELGLGLKFDNRPKPLAIAFESASHSIQNLRVDLIHHTFYSKLFWQPRFRGPRVSTQYDMIPELFKEKRFLINPHLSKHFYFKNVNHIIAISNSAKSDLRKVWPDVVTPISVTHLATHETVTPTVKRISGSVLFVGVRQGYKDAENLIRAFAKVPPNLRSNLRFVGGGPFNETEKSLFAELGITHLVSQENLSEEELTLAYGSSHIFVFPSRYEGFGLPVLEALQNSCRALLAGTEIFQEIAGNAAEYFSPGDERDLSVQLTRILSDDPDINPLQRAGHDRTAQFSWQKTASATSEIYQQVLNLS
jgi:glycosyltransferase involved in cell wall biosynthesis